MKILGNVIIYIGLFLVFMATLGSPTGEIVWPWLGVGAVVLAVGTGATRAGAQRQQDRQDKSAKQLLESGNLSGKALYLRPFDTDGKFTVTRESGSLFDWDQYDRPGLDSLERMVSDAFAATSVLIAAGGKGGGEFGPGTTGYLDDWKAKISKAITTASWIVIVPSAQPGTLWEIGEIMRVRALQKTIFIMPPNVAPLDYTGPVPLSKLWALAVEACSKEYGLKLPLYDRAGAIFRLHESNAGGLQMAQFDMRSPNALTNAINSVL